MTFHFEHIPYQELNGFYKEVVASMHVSLQPLATDMRVLRHEPVERHTDHIAEELYQPQYSYVPWMIADYVDIPADVLLNVGKAWWLTIIDAVITDQMVDRQIPNLVEIPLMLQHLRLQSERLYREIFGHDERLWEHYDRARAGLWDGLAHETYCVDQHQRAYSFEEMRKVCKSRSDLIAMIITAMGNLAGETSAVEPLCTFYECVTFADQLLDDASDWKSDFSTGRYTLPIIMALEAAQLPLEDIERVSLEKLAGLMDRHRILLQLSERATVLLEQSRAALSGLGKEDSSLQTVLNQRLQVAQHATKRYRTLRLMSGFIHKLEAGR